MPRVRQTQSGDRAMPTGTGMAGVRYGEGVELQGLQAALPTPNARAGVPPSPAPAQQPGLPAEAGVASSPAPMPKPGLLLAPSTRPNEPLTAGLSRGPGVGPEALVAPSVTPTARFLRELADVTGRDAIRRLADRARAR